MSVMPEQDTLGQRFRRGEESALTEMYRSYSRPMFATAFSLLGDHQLAADTVQQAFVQAWQAADSFDPRRELKPWLYMITRRVAIDVYRRESRSRQQLSWDTAEVDPAVDPLDIVSIWRAWKVREALDRLHPDEAEVLRLAYFEGLSQSEIARQLNCPLGTVKSRTSRAQRRLVELLAHLQTD